MKKRLAAAGSLLAALALVFWLGQDGVEAEVVEQEPWHLIRAEAVSEGIEVEIAGENLMLLSGVRVKADSEENRSFSASKVRDGISDDSRLRWSSANDWENNEHWLEIDFGQRVRAGLVRIYWERANACAYTLEYSSDAKSWETAAEFVESPQALIQDIAFEETIEAEFLRLHVTAVTKDEADLSLYYQNVSVLELEVYEEISDAFLIRRPEIPAGSNRQLDVNGTVRVQDDESGTGKAEDAVAAEIPVALPEVPADYGLEFVGADYEMLVDAEGRIANTIADTQVELGFALVRDGVRWELPGMRIKIPAAASEEGGKDRPEGGAELPADFSVMEWKPGEETFSLADQVEIVLSPEQQEELSASAQLFAQELSAYLGREVSVHGGSGAQEKDGAGASAQDAEAQSGMISLVLVSGENEEWITGLSKEGYGIELKEQNIRIYAKTAQGLRWGCVTFLELLDKAEGRLPEGQIRDYPRYGVRGFGIDVGRRAISMELLYRIVEAMSKEKMNTLQIHLNDNQIIAQSDYDGTESGARSLYAGFRLESDLKNEEGEKITSEDLFYTKEEFMRFIADAAVYGVEIVPEIDTPAHSLAITNVFPKLGLSGNPESVDQLDLSREEAVELGKALWSEYLTASSDSAENGSSIETSGAAVFAGCRAVHIGMDEYFGEEKAYISYLTELSSYVREIAPDKQIRIWGSLSMITADHSGVSTDLQLHIWDTDWADPQDMYGEGFSIINSLSSSLYIIPGGGYDWLDQDFLEERWQPNVFETQERTWTLPAYSSQMLGAVYMMWNDWSHLNGEAITEEDLFARFVRPLPVIASKLWGDYCG